MMGPWRLLVAFSALFADARSWPEWVQEVQAVGAEQDAVLRNFQITAGKPL